MTLTMDGEQLLHRLRQALESSYSDSEMETLVAELEPPGPIVEVVSTILCVMEEHRDVDYASPGPLVYFLDRLVGTDYDRELLASVPRRPTLQAVWMLNRLINGAEEAESRARLIEAIHVAATSADADSDTRDLVEYFLARLSE